MITAFAAALLLQIRPLGVHMQVDRPRVHLGDDVLLTIEATSRRTDPIQLQLPALGGLELLSRSERTEVAPQANPARRTVWELRLRASTVGRWRIGPARVRQAGVMAEADPVQVDVRGTQASAGPQELNPRLQRLLARAPPPPGRDEAAVAIIASADTVFVGQQVDLVTAAWFPRELRLQLRRPPTLQVPTVDGVWSYPQHTPSGIAASRQVGGRWFDLFVVHQIVFPLTAGNIIISPATLHYSVPLAFQFFSQEERYTLKSRPRQLHVRPLPTRGQPASFGGAVAHGLTLRREVTPRTVKAGEPFTVSFTLQGEGNLALWPEPELAWPTGVRAYPRGTDDSIALVRGMLGGTRRFSYLVLSDSGGAVPLPAVRYTYFDPMAERYQRANLPGVSYAVAPEENAAPARAMPPPLLPGTTPAIAWRWTHAVPVWVVPVLLFLPLLLLLPRLRRVPAGEPAAAPVVAGELEGMLHRLDRAVDRLTGGRGELEGDALAGALRTAGVAPDLSERVAAAREAGRRARFGPGRRTDGGGPASEIAALLRQLDERERPETGAPRAGLVAGLLLLVCVPAAWSQSQPSAEQLYGSGALQAAAGEFASRASLEPGVAAHWYNLGAAEYRLGRSGEALADWVRARRLAPRDPTIRRALRLLPYPDAATARALWVPPVTPWELALAAAACWLLGWLGWLVHRQRRRRWHLVLGLALVLALAGYGLDLWYRRPVAVVATDTTLYLSPHELAPAVARLATSQAVLVRSVRPGWRLVQVPQGPLGWLPDDAVVPLRSEPDGPGPD